jgi:hypothetical protein
MHWQDSRIDSEFCALVMLGLEIVSTRCRVAMQFCLSVRPSVRPSVAVTDLSVNLNCIICVHFDISRVTRELLCNAKVRERKRRVVLERCHSIKSLAPGVLRGGLTAGPRCETRHFQCQS